MVQGKLTACTKLDCELQSPRKKVGFAAERVLFTNGTENSDQPTSNSFGVKKAHDTQLQAINEV